MVAGHTCWMSLGAGREAIASPVAQAVPVRSGGLLARGRSAQPLAYLAALTAAELVSVLGDARAGLLMHTLLISVIFSHAAFLAREADRGLLLAMSLAPLVRILSLSMPLENVGLRYWYAAVAVPLVIGSLVVAQTLGLSRRDLGLTPGSMRVQLLIASTGFAFGFMEYLILRPDALADALTFEAIWLPAVILLVGTGFTEELVFRGVMQSAVREALGKASVVYVAAVFAVLHVGYESVLDVAFVFAIGYFFGLVVRRTRSIFGVTLSHGITNIMLFLVVPFL